MGTSRYLANNHEAAAAHDEKLNEVELHLLERILAVGSPSGARHYAEAYALVRGHVTSTGSTEIRN